MKTNVTKVLTWYFCYLQTAHPVYRPRCPVCLTGPCVSCLPPVQTSPAVSTSLSWTERLRYNWLWTAPIMYWGHMWTRYPEDSPWLATALGHRRFWVFKGSISYCKYHITFYMYMDIPLCIQFWVFSWALQGHRKWDWLSIHALKYSVSFIQ